VKLCAAVKCDGYGHGVDLLWPVITEQADWLGVATPDEALHLRAAGYDGPLLVFFAANAQRQDKTLTEELLQRRVTLTIASPDAMEDLTAAAKRTGLDAQVHVMVDTGMTRSGLLPGQTPEIVSRLRVEPHLRLTGIYTHLACADHTDKTSACEQLRRFDQTLQACGIHPNSGLLRHAANSAGVIDLPESHYDMARPGISVYGYQPSDEMTHRPPLRPVLRLTGPLMQVKTVPARTRCGYGLTHEFSRDSRVGLVPIGYGDGYFRCWSNRAFMRVRERDVPVCGRVSMDQTIVDLTDAPEANVGDEVEILSNDPQAPHSVEGLARLASTIPHEVTTRLGSRIRRVCVE
jgi:alanine racemase